MLLDTANTDASVPTDSSTSATGGINGRTMTRFGTITLDTADGQQAGKLTDEARLTYLFGLTLPQSGKIIVAINDTQSTQGNARAFHGDGLASVRWQMSVAIQGDLTSVCAAFEIDMGAVGALGKAVITATYVGASSEFLSTA